MRALPHSPPSRPCRLILPAFALLLAFPAWADVRLPALFGDHMVLQQEATLPVWGWADPGETVAVVFGSDQARATAGADGKWRADLSALPAGSPPGTLVISGKNTLILRDVLVGDVWLCSGQSNMELPLARTDNAKAAVAQASDSQLRLFHVARQIALAPRQDVRASWELCTPETAARFSGVGYFFGKNLRPVLGHPLGLIEADWGATPAQSWTDLPTLQGNPSLRHYLATFRKFAARYPGGDAELGAATRTGALPMIPAAARRTVGPVQKIPTLLFNGMIAPLIPYAIKGAIWYQGADNADNEAPGASLEYRILFPALITGWRSRWGEGDFPFLYVQLPNFAGRPKAKWPVVRESQLKALALPNTGMAVTIDIGTFDYIHPSDKADVGQRLALAARHIAYGENLVYRGPLFAGMQAGGGSVRISYRPDSVGGGLIIGSAPWVYSKSKPLSTDTLKGFAIAGADRRWFPAEARIEGDTVVLAAAQVPSPVAVRYAWADNPSCNLYNKEGLPACPFRTDAWVY